MGIKEKIRTIPDFPKPGIMFRDITTLLKDPEGLSDVIDNFYDKYKDQKIDVIAGIEARGFILGAALAYKMGLGFIPIRKKGKLPGATESFEYDLEYGTDTIEVHNDAVDKGANVLIVDDLLATGGTSVAAARLIEKVGGNVVDMAFIVDLPDVGGRKKLKDAGYSYYFLCEFEGD